MAKYNVHGGHNTIVSGAVKYLNEVTEDRKVKDKIISLLRAQGHTVYDCTDNVGRTQNQNLVNIVSKCNAHSVDLDISIHLNAGGGTGCEVFYYTGDSKGREKAAAVSAKISKALGIKDRGAKATNSLYVVSNTKATAILVECCFVDSVTDKERWDANKCAAAIVEGITGKSVPNQTVPDNKPAPPKTTKLFWVTPHIQGTGWGARQPAEDIIGTIGKSKRLEAIKIEPGVKKIKARAHIQNKGWIDYGTITKDTVIGVTGESKRLECICFEGDFDYRVHLQGSGWTDWTSADGVSTLGTVGQRLRIEAIQFR